MNKAANLVKRKLAEFRDEMVAGGLQGPGWWVGVDRVCHHDTTI